MAIFFAGLDAALCALNVGLYADGGHPLNAGVAAFCGLLVFVQLAMRQ